MLSRCHTAAPSGIGFHPIEVEVDLAPGLPGFTLVGLPDHASKEGKERVRAALRHQGFSLPRGKVVVNLAPATLRKRGGGLDLPLAAGVLASTRQLPEGCLDGWALWGELAFDGRLREAPGGLGVALGLANHPGVRRLLLPRGCGTQAAVCEDLEVFEATDLAEAAAILAGEADAPPLPATPIAEPPPPDWSEVRDAPHAFRALTTAAAGGHGVLMVGPPGCGKTFLARRLVDLLPPLDRAAALEVARIHSSIGLLAPGEPVRSRPPFRSPNPTVSREALVGGGTPLRPGEITLAHRGVLFLDEAAEFHRPVLDALRSPLVEGEVRLGRVHGVRRFPARFQLVLAMNPCPCGFDGDPDRPCVCAPAARLRYQARVSGPLLDRVDLRVRVAAPDPGEDGPAPDPRRLAERVRAARARQAARWGEGGLNAQVGLAALLEAFPGGKRPTRLEFLAPRAAAKTLGLALTLADLAGRDPTEDDVDAAIALRIQTPGERAA